MGFFTGLNNFQLKLFIINYINNKELIINKKVNKIS